MPIFSYKLSASGGLRSPHPLPWTPLGGGASEFFPHQTPLRTPTFRYREITRTIYGLLYTYVWRKKIIKIRRKTSNIRIGLSPKTRVHDKHFLLTVCMSPPLLHRRRSRYTNWPLAWQFQHRYANNMFWSSILTRSSWKYVPQIFASKCIKNRFRPGIRPNHAGRLTTLPRPPSGMGRGTSPSPYPSYSMSSAASASRYRLDAALLNSFRSRCFISFYRAIHVLAGYCYRKSSVRPSVCLSVCLSVTLMYHERMC